MNTGVKSHKDLVVWQKAVTLSLDVYKLTNNFPSREIYGLSSQMRRAAISIPSNIAEGSGRSTRKDYANFLHIAYGSTAELETQMLIALRLSFFDIATYESVNALLVEVSKMLRAMIEKLETAV